MKVLVDGDVISYRVAFSAKDEPLPVALDKLDDLIDSIKDFIDPLGVLDPEYQFFLTGKGNFRHKFAKTAVYKGNRKDTEKPAHLENIRLQLINKYKAIVSVEEEADDLIAIAAAKEDYKKVVIVSTDKDFGQLPVSILNPTKMEIRTVTPWEATKSFYLQILTGDTVDNIKGIYGIGPAKAAKLIEGCDNEFALYQACLEAYRFVQDNKIYDCNKEYTPEERVLENGRLLWLRRYEGEIWNGPKQ